MKAHLDRRIPSIRGCAAGAWAPLSLLSDACFEANLHRRAPPTRCANIERRERPARTFGRAAIWVLLAATALGGLFVVIPA